MNALCLAPKIDLSQAAPLAAALRERVGKDIVIDAGAVTMLGGLGLQILLSAAQSWRASGLRMTIAPRSEAFDQALESFGIGPDELQAGGSA